jgi:hypothetical protein
MGVSRPTDGMGVFCTRCNAEMEPDAGFCPNCGEPRLLQETVLTTDEPTRVYEEEIIEERPPVLVEEHPVFPAWAAVLLGVLGTLVIVLLVVLFVRNDNGSSSSTTTTVPTVTVPPAPTVVTVPVPVIVTPPQTSPPATSPPTTAPAATTTTTGP